MKYFRHFREYPFITVLIGSTLLLTLIGYLGKNNIYDGYSVDLWKAPQLTVVLESIKDRNYPWKIASSGNKEVDEVNDVSAFENDNESKISPDIGKQSGEDGHKKDTDNNKETDADIDTDTDTDAKVDKNTETDTDADTKQEDGKTTCRFTKVNTDYFDDALFIGDSRTVGLSEYSGWNNPTFYADSGLTIYDVFDKEIAVMDGKKMTIEKALEKKSFGKIYIMLGINELGTGNTETFIAEYKKVIEKIQRLQPGTILFVEGIMNVSRKKSDSDPIFNNNNIKDKNDHLALLADNKDIFYIDVNEAITDETGGIPIEYTFDNIHLKAAYYSLWTDFLLEHGVVREK